MFCIFIDFNKKKMVGVKIPRVGVKITRGSLTPGGQAAQGVKINCPVLEKISKVFFQIRAWRPSWSCDQHHVIKFLFPCTGQSR